MKLLARSLTTLFVAVGLASQSHGQATAPQSFPPCLIQYGFMGTSTKWSSDPNLVNGYDTIFALAGAFPLNSGSDCQRRYEMNLLLAE
jgi:hypothetical protein